MMRKVTGTDISALVALQTAVENESAIWGYRADPPDVWAGRDLSWTLLAFDGETPAGFIHCVPRPCSGESVFPPDSRVLEIMDLIVSEPHRGRGLGHELVAAIREHSRHDGFTHLRVYSAAKRFDDILRFYRFCGFTPWYLEMTQGIGKKDEPRNVG